MSGYKKFACLQEIVAICVMAFFPKKQNNFLITIYFNKKGIPDKNSYNDFVLLPFLQLPYTYDIPEFPLCSTLQMHGFSVRILCDVQRLSSEHMRLE